MAFFLASCGAGQGTSDRVSGKILKKFSQEMKGKGLRMVGSGGGINHEIKKINLISATFFYEGVMDMKSARRLTVDSTNTFLQLINEDPINEQFFEIFPAPMDIIKLIIIGAEPEKKGISFISSTILGEGEILYYTKISGEEKRGELTTEESFQKAQAIVNKEGCS